MSVEVCGTNLHPQFDAYVVLDFEATCEAGRRIRNQEIIEFPFVVVDARKAAAVTSFQRYVRPVHNPKLSNFCVNLTGISQDVVNQAKPFGEVFSEVLAFLRACKLEGNGESRRRYCIVTCGDWDLRTMLPSQIRLLHSTTTGQLPPVPKAWECWCNIKHYACSPEAVPAYEKRGLKPPGKVGDMLDLLELLQLPHEGRHHSGIDDCRNIASIVCRFIQDGCFPFPTAYACSDEQSGGMGEGKHEKFEFSWPPPSLDPWTLAHPSPPSRHADPTVRSGDAQPHAKTHAKAKIRLQVAYNNNNNNTSQSSNAPKAEQRCRENNKKPPSASSPVAQSLPYIDVDLSVAALENVLQPYQQEAQREGSPLAVNTTAISKALSHILRHSAFEKRIPISCNGFSSVDDILAHPTFPLRNTPKADAVMAIVSVVRTNNKQRFQLGVGMGDKDKKKLYIAANQGHSMAGIEVAMRRIERPEEVPVCIHGTNLTAWNIIKECGYLSRMRRQHIHFSKGLPSDGGVISGMRNSARVLLYLDVPKALEDGVALLESANGVLLTPGVGTTGQLPLTYISKAVDREGNVFPF